jgi:hypothetical protein
MTRRQRSPYQLDVSAVVGIAVGMEQSRTRRCWPAWSRRAPLAERASGQTQAARRLSPPVGIGTAGAFSVSRAVYPHYRVMLGRCTGKDTNNDNFHCVIFGAP